MCNFVLDQYKKKAKPTVSELSSNHYQCSVSDFRHKQEGSLRYVDDTRFYFYIRLLDFYTFLHLFTGKGKFDFVVLAPFSAQ